MEKRLLVEMNGSRKISGVLRGFDPFMNIVLDDAVEEVSESQKNDLGRVVRSLNHFTRFIV